MREESERDVYPSFPKNHHHLIKLLLVFSCAVCVKICVLLFYFILNQPYTSTHVVTSSSFNHPIFLMLVCLTVENLCFDWILILPQSLPIWIFPKGKKTNEHQHNWIMSPTTRTSSQQNVQSFLKSVFVHHEIYLSH